MKKIHEIEFNDIWKSLKILFISTFIILGLYIWIFQYIPNIVNINSEIYRFIMTRHAFFYLQIIITMFGILILHVAIKDSINIKSFIFYILLSTTLVYFRFFHELHNIFNKYNLYLDIFKTGIDNNFVISFQYVRVFLIGIISLLMIYSFIFVRKSFLKILVILLSASFFLFFYFMHLYVARAAFYGYENELRIQNEVVLKNSDNYIKMCNNMNLLCNEINIDDIDNFKMSVTSKLNRIRDWEDSTEESNKMAIKLMKDFLKTEKESMVFMESNIVADNLRAATYAFKITENNKILIVMDFNYLAYALDLYLLYFTLITSIFLLIWGYACTWVYKKHIKMHIIKKWELA